MSSMGAACSLWQAACVNWFPLLRLIAPVVGFAALYFWVVRRQRLAALTKAVDVEAIAEIALLEAARMRHSAVTALHFLDAIALDPQGQRVLRAARMDPVAFGRAVQAQLASSGLPKLPDGRDYRNAEANAIATGWTVSFLRRLATRQRLTVPGLLVQLSFEEGAEHILDAHGFARASVRDLVVSNMPVAPAVELVNDNVTTVDFVIEALADLAKMDEPTAMAFSRAVHFRGREWIALPSAEEAHRLAAALTERARAAGFPLEAKAIVE